MIAYTCPTCGVLFKSPPEHQNNKRRCPGCRIILQLPFADSHITLIPKSPEQKKDEIEKVAKQTKPSELLKIEPKEKQVKSPSPRAKSSSKPTRKNHSKKKKRKPKIKKKNEQIIKEQGAVIKKRKLFLLLLLALFILLGGGVYIYYNKELLIDKIQEKLHSDSSQQEADITLAHNKKKNLNPVELHKLQLRIKEFLNADSIQSLAPLIRDSNRVMPLIRAYYQQNEYLSVGCLQAAVNDSVRINGNYISAITRLPDQTEKVIALEIKGNLFYVDWESWVGYSEMEWRKIIEKKPITQIFVRALVEPSNYYKHNFLDSEKWICYKLNDINHSITLYGYVSRDNYEVKEELEKNNLQRACIINIKYPSDSNSSNQVLITDYITNGWIYNQN